MLTNVTDEVGSADAVAAEAGVATGLLLLTAIFGLDSFLLATLVVFFSGLGATLGGVAGVGTTGNGLMDGAGVSAV